MGPITDIAKLAGKTIEKAIMLDCEETFGLLFTDGTYCSIDVHFYDDSHDLEFDGSGDLSGRDLVTLGVITESELEVREARENRRLILFQEDHERKQYELLKAKYDPEGLADE